MTHTCSYKSYCKFGAAFLYYLQTKNDFSISLYNSIVASEFNDNQESFSMIYRYGDQYHRCVNNSKAQCSGYHFITTQCLLFEMITLVDTERSCMKVSGYTNSDFYGNKEISHVNFLGKGQDNKPIFYLDSGTAITLTISDSVILHSNTYLVQFDSSNNGFTLVLNKCIIPADFSGYDNNKVKTSNCDTAYYDTNKVVVYPHFTRGEQCKGVKQNEPESAKNCNVGNCIDNCERSIGFPPDVFTYTTIFHGDIQTPTPTPTEKFSRSLFFSQSFKFTESDKFSFTGKFSESDKFSQSKAFSKTGLFSKTDFFSKSFGFTNSGSFTESLRLDQTRYFTASKSFTPSQKFTKTSDFSKSGFFSKSSDFSKSSFFSETADFSKSSEFTNSFSFSDSDTLVVPIGGIVDREPVIDPGNSDTSKKSNKGVVIGAVVGSVAAAAIIAALIIFFVVKKKRMQIPTNDADIVGETASSITVDNNLQSMMDKDDPFAADFDHNELQDIK